MDNDYEEDNMSHNGDISGEDNDEDNADAEE